MNGFYAGEKRQRGGRKKRKKTKEESQVIQNWDDIYDSTRPNNYEDYKHSDEQIAEIRQWKDKLYAHRLVRRHSSDSDSSRSDHRPPLNSMYGIIHVNILGSDRKIDEFRPSKMSFAPPPSYEPSGVTAPESKGDGLPGETAGEDAYVESRYSSGPSEPNVVPISVSALAPTPISHHKITPPKFVMPPQKEMGTPPTVLSSIRNLHSAQTISRAPVRYNLPAPPSDLPASEAELESALHDDQEDEDAHPDAAPRSLRPGQKGFAERLMSKYGWSKGSGLGASGSGIVNPLRVQVEKQKKKSDSEGGGFVGPGGRGKIIGGKKKGPETQEGRFGAMSEVVLLRGMLDNIDLDVELGPGDGGLVQEIGEECGEKVSFVTVSGRIF